MGGRADPRVVSSDMLTRRVPGKMRRIGTDLTPCALKPAARAVRRAAIYEPYPRRLSIGHCIAMRGIDGKARRRFWVGLSVSAVGVLGLNALSGFLFAADVYRWVDRNGRVHYGDRPVASAHLIDIPDTRVFVRVEKVIDGDTVSLANGEKIRLLSINAPEVDSRFRSAESGGEEAKRWLASRIEGKSVRIETDVTRRDKYGRFLAHAFTSEGDHVNLELVRMGLAAVNIHPPDLAYSKEMLRAQTLSEGERSGIWGDSAYAPIAIDGLSRENAKGWRRLYGVPTGVRRGRNFEYLIFSPTFDVRIPLEHRKLFSDISSYIGRSVEVRGWPSRRGEHFSVLARHPSALVIK